MTAPTKTLSIHRSTAVSAAIITVLMVAIAVLGASLWSAKGELAARDTRTADQLRAEQIATDYAVGASNVNYQDINPWLTKLKDNTSPQLANKFDATAPKLQELLVPLKWVSTSAPVDATVASEAGGIYKVNVFLNVTSNSAQSPDGAQTTVTYIVTIDKNAQWKITDVGGMDGAFAAR